ncbi:MAG: adenylate/guanylate cyclase domain-containing protein [Mariprofundaceae bacterium]|nr:adenylate/guanylate cyclase domain-containing protein [Mariprofundaceae bacterium]
MTNLLTSKQVIEKANISRATLNNYIALDILPKPVIKKPESGSARAPRIGCFPSSVLEIIEKINLLKGQGHTMAQIAEKLKVDTATTSKRVMGNNALPFKSIDSTSFDNPKLNCDQINYPSYFLSYKFQLEWCNDVAVEQLFGDSWKLSSRIEERNIFQLLFDSTNARNLDGFEDILSFHLALAKGKLSKSTLLISNLNIDHECLTQLIRLHDEVEPADIKPIIYKEMNISLQDESHSCTQIFASFFREGILITYLPSADDAESLVSILARRNHVIGNLLRKRRPFLTNMTILVADLQNSCNICAELPPDEYFELINMIWGTMEKITRKYNAVSGKHVGDGAVFYFFPRPEENYVFNAIKFAQEMKEVMLDISKKWKNKKNWINDLLLNIGITEGEEWFGTYQTSTQIEFTVLGCTVNRAGRLSDFAQQGSIWATKNVLSKLTPTEREEVRFGIKRQSEDGQVLIPSSYSRISNLIDMDNPRYEKMRDIGADPVAEIFDVMLTDFEVRTDPESGIN